VRCQYCGKNLWPLRGLFDEDFCSRDHRQRYNERVRKALEHLPKSQAIPRPTGIAGFQFERPRVQESAVTLRGAGQLRENASTPAVPEFAYATASPALAAPSFSFASPAPAAGSRPRATGAAVHAIAPNVMSIDSLRQRLHRNEGVMAVAMVDAPAGVAPRATNMVLKASQRGSLMPQAFDELNHVYLHEPEPIIETGLPFGENFIAQMTPVSSAAKAKHTAAAGPSGAGRVEFFPMQRRSGAAFHAGAEADTLPEMAFHSGDNIWLEDFMSWRIPVSMAPNRSSMAMLPAVDRAAALDRFRTVSPASASSAAPLAWEFETTSIERNGFKALRLGIAPAAVIEFPNPRNGAAAPLSDEVAIFDAATFNLWMPEIAVDAGDLEMLTEELADVSLACSDILGPQTQIGETLLPRGLDWFPIEAEAVLPASSPEMLGALAEPKLDAGLVAKQTPAMLRNGAQSVKPDMQISMPHRAVRLKQGPEFFAAEPVIADSVARPVTARMYAVCAPLAMPELRIANSDSLFQPASTQALLPAGGVAGVASLGASGEAIETAGIEMPVIEPRPAGFVTANALKMDLWVRDAVDRLPHHFGWMAPQFALLVPELEHEELPLALKVDVPEPRTVTVFETAKYHKPSNVLAIGDAPTRRFTVPSYMKGMAAGLMLASFLWFGSSSIKSEGITMRPGDLIRLTIQRRAAYEIGDNFHAGLASWDGKNFSRTWLYDKEGYIRPGRLALYKPSREMADYKLEFLTQIERKSVGWVFRAADDQNYYAMKLAVTEPGPRPLVALMRYQVIDGKKESRGETPLQVMMHNNRPYRVEVDVKGNKFLTSIEGQLVDSWSDDRLKSGGVGFFTDSSEKARLYWMKITKNSDFLGKLCSILVPKES
jgi:hypothetical protein